MVARMIYDGSVITGCILVNAEYAANGESHVQI